ncbi:MAG: hypothetical protein LBQ27_03105 [Clostridiales bacterium]|jgi:hypothetical protein|nr:hypothetical protein [Clostridiales bacterium]
MSGVSAQPAEFFFFAVAGFVSAFFYGLFWLFRHFIKPNGFFEIASDFLFVILSGVVFLFCLTQKTDGGLKPFYFLAFLTAFATGLSALNCFKELLLSVAKKIYARVSPLWAKIRIKKSPPINDEARNRETYKKNPSIKPDGSLKSARGAKK